MMDALTCVGCGAQVHPTGRSQRFRCDYCGADNVLDAATAAALAGSVAPPPGVRADALLARLSVGADGGAAFLDALAAKLEPALPGKVVAERKGGLFAKTRTVRVVVELGARRFTLALGHGDQVEGSCAHVVRGVTLKNEMLPLAALLDALTAELYELAQQSKEAHAAMIKLQG